MARVIFCVNVITRDSSRLKFVLVYFVSIFLILVEQYSWLSSTGPAFLFLHGLREPFQRTWRRRPTVLRFLPTQRCSSSPPTPQTTPNQIPSLKSVAPHPIVGARRTPVPATGHGNSQPPPSAESSPVVGAGGGGGGSSRARIGFTFSR